MYRKIINSYYKFNRKLDDDKIFKLPALTVLMLASNLLIFFGGKIGIVIGLSLIFLLSISALFRSQMQTGFVKFDYSIYKVPEKGDVIVVTKDFVIDKIKRNFRLGDSLRMNLKAGDECEVYNILKENEEIIIVVGNKDEQGFIYYFKTHGKWKTKSEIRDKKLKQLLS